MGSSTCKCVPRENPDSKLDVVVSSLRRESAYLIELSRQQSEHIKLLESFQQLRAKDEKIALPSEQLSKTEGSQKDMDSTPDEQASTNKAIELQNRLSDALEKNKQWLEYDQQREAYVRAILARMSLLERQLNEANQARSQQHNEDHSEEEKISQMQEHYERLLKKARDELYALRRRSANSELERFLLNRHHADQEKIAELERQIKISSQDLEDEKQNCSYLKKHIFRLLKTQKRKEDMTKQSKRDQQTPCEAARLPSLCSSDRLTFPPHSNLLNESFLECPGCGAQYPASHHRELIVHIEVCLG